MKRLLLVNFAECPENLHFERALARAVARRRGLALDVLHDFDYHYDFIGVPAPPRGRRRRCAGLAALQKDLGRPDALLLLDFPKRARCATSWLWLARQAPAAEKFFVANHLIPMPGHNFTADLARKYRALAGVKAGCMLEFDDKELWREMGLSGARLLRRGYASDCEYYKPLAGPAGNYAFSAGSAGRDYAALAAGARRAGFGIKIFTDSGPGRLPAAAEVLPLARNLHNLREAAGRARAVVIPVKDAHVNEAAGNSIAFLSMALGRPVLVKRTPYMERFIQDGVNGFLYDSLTPEDLAAGLRRIAALTPAKLKKLGAAARRTALAKASLDRFCAEFLKERL
ncbi:MAG: glycosyltransferase [Elusimicrobiales bacterium]|nr:glycosyltransferase [Elusimicrobiales bacterium]